MESRVLAIFVLEDLFVFGDGVDCDFFVDVIVVI